MALWTVRGSLEAPGHGGPTVLEFGLPWKRKIPALEGTLVAGVRLLTASGSLASRSGEVSCEQGQERTGIDHRCPDLHPSCSSSGRDALRCGVLGFP